MNQVESGSSPGAHCLRIIVLDIHTDLWCEECAALSAVAITYLVEAGRAVPEVLSRFAYCATCEGE